MAKLDKIRAAVILIIYFSLILGCPHLSRSEDGYDKAVKLGIKLRTKPLLDFAVKKRIPSNLLIQNNTFRLASGWPVKTAQTAQHLLNPNRNIFGVLQASFNWPVGQWDIEESGLRMIRNLYIENNRFINWWQNPGIALNNGLHVLIKGNTFELDDAFAATALTGTPIAVKVVNSTDVRIEDNILTGAGLNPENGIRLIDSGRIVLKNNQKK
jgi:hypothetical protein